MDAFATASAFFHACESLKGWEGCQEYVADGATFESQCEPLTDISTVEAYCEWMAGLGSGPLAGCSYEINASSYDESTRTAMFFGTFTGTHNGEGGPVPPTGKTARAHYVYLLTLDDSGKVCRMIKVWNAPWTLNELGWA
jgi:hypothetical protein